MNLKQTLLTFLENNLFLKNGTCPICGRVLFVTDRFLCHQCQDDLPVINNPTCTRCGRPIFRSDRQLCTPCAKDNLPFAGGYVADTPGFGNLNLEELDLGTLATDFREFIPLASGCRFTTCTHTHEPDCAVKAALTTGEVAQSRYNSYVSMLTEIKNKKEGNVKK